MNLGNFTNVTISKMIAKIINVSSQFESDFIIVGSSLGGYTGAIAASKGLKHLKGCFYDGSCIQLL